MNKYIASFYVRRQTTPDGDSERNLKVKVFDANTTVLEVVCWYDSYRHYMGKSDLRLNKEKLNE